MLDTKWYYQGFSQPNSMIITVCFLVAATVIASLVLYLSRYLVKEKTIPGLILTTAEDGNIGEIKAAGSFQNFLQNLHNLLGPIASFWYGGLYTVSIASPELFKEHAHAFDRPLLFVKHFEPLFGRASITFTNGEEGRCRRKMYDRAFAHNRLGSYFKTFQKSADVIVQQWSARGKDELFPICEETFKFVLRSSMCSMLGEYCENDEVVYNFRKAYLKANEELSKIPGDPAHCEDPKAMERFQEALTFMRKTVKCALEYHRTTTSHGNLAVDEIVEYASDEETVICDCITYLFASFHNTGKMLSICLFYLAKHEDIQDKLYTEILKVLGNSQLVDESNLRSLKYMRQVIDESIRCGAFGAFAARYQDVDITLGGYKILKNTPVVQALGIVMRDEKIWPMPMKFDPDRFNEENTKARSPFAFKPFGFSGKRACPGTKLVYRESSVLLATILRRFKIELHGDQQIEIEHGLATHSTEEIWAKLVKR